MHYTSPTKWERSRTPALSRGTRVRVAGGGTPHPANFVRRPLPSDLEASASWYARVLGMTREDVPQAGGKPPRTEMKFGRQKINLRPIATSKADWFTADHKAFGGEDLCFITISKPTRSFATCRLTASPSAPAPARDAAQGALTSVYCRDPDGDLIEIASYLGR